MRSDKLTTLFSGTGDSALAVIALVFLHELARPQTLGQPPREARWERILEQPAREWAPRLIVAARHA